MEQFKISIEKYTKPVTKETLTSKETKISIIIKDKTVTFNPEIKQNFIEDIPLYFLSSLLIGIPEISKGISHKCIFFETPFSLEFTPQANSIQILSAWEEDLDYLNEKSGVTKIIYELPSLVVIKEILRACSEFYDQVMASGPDREVIQFLAGFKEDLEKLKKDVD